MVDDLRIVPERDESRAMPKSNRPAATGASTKARSNATKQPVQKASGGSSVLVGLLCIMVALVSGAAAYLYLQTQTLSEVSWFAYSVGICPVQAFANNSLNSAFVIFGEVL